MGDISDSWAKLHSLSEVFENEGDLDSMLNQLAQLSAHILSAEDCYIALCSGDENRETYLGACAGAGKNGAKATQEAFPKTKSIADYVAENGQALLIQDITDSPFADMAAPGLDNSVVSAPILSQGKTIGTITVSNPTHKPAFTSEDLHLLDFIGLMTGKSIQLVQLRNILKSRFALMALTKESEKTIGDALIDTVQNPDQMAKILAKSFYREMTKAGFSSGQIINAASEIISELSKNLQKHSQRLKR